MGLGILTIHSISISNPLCSLIRYTSKITCMLMLMETVRACLFGLLGWMLWRTFEPSLAGDSKFVSSVAQRYAQDSQPRSKSLGRL